MLSWDCPFKTREITVFIHAHELTDIVISQWALDVTQRSGVSFYGNYW